MRKACAAAARTWTNTGARPNVRSLATRCEQLGGLVSADRLAALLGEVADQPVSLVAGWLAGRRILSFTMDGQTMVPLFQFDRTALAMRASVTAVICVLQDKLPDVEIAEWFVRCNCWLGGPAPADVLDSRLADVMDAARADRSLVRGPGQAT